MKTILGIVCLLHFVSLYAQIDLTYYGDLEALDSINTPFDEGPFALLPNAEGMVYTVKGHPENIGGKFNPGDLWFAPLAGLRNDISPSANLDPMKLVTPLGFVNQGDLFLYNTTFFDKGVFKGEINLADYRNGEFKNPRKMAIPFFNNLSEHQSGSISANGQHLLISMESTSSYGVEDLYVSHLQSDGSWSSPKNLGYRVNTAFQEYTPWLAPDNETLFFSSNGRENGIGSFDIYVTSRVDDTWQNWTEPKNIGSPINTIGAETSFQISADGIYAYFVSTTDSDGYGDIKRIRIQTDFEVDTTQIVAIEVKEEEVFYSKYFSITSSKDQEVISGNIKVQSDSSEVIYSSPSVIEFEVLKDLKLEATAEGYLTRQLLLSSSELSLRDTISIEMEPLEVGVTIQLNNVLFYQGTANFVEGSLKELDLVVQMMQDNPNVRINLSGHTDNVGDPQLNLELSNERVKVVRDYIISRGVDFTRLTGKGYGGNAPLVPNTSEANRKLNRRVEFTIVAN